MGRDGDAAAGLGQHVGDPRDRRADDGAPGREVLGELHRAADRELGAARREAHARGRDVGRHERAVVDEADEADAVGDAVRAHERLDGWALVAVADEDEQRARAP